MSALDTRRAHWLAALVAGLLHAASIADWFAGQPRWWLQFAALAVLAGLVERAPSLRTAAFLSWTFATAWLAGTFWWLFISMHTYGGLPSPLAALAVLGLAGFLALYHAAAGAGYARWARGGIARRALMFASLWLVAELLRASWFTGFPWGASGYAHVDGPLVALAPWIGVYGIGFVVAFLAAVVASSARDFKPARWRTNGWAVAIPLVMLLIPHGAAQSNATPGRGISIALLQGNIPQDEKFQGGSGIPIALRWYGQQLRDAKASLVVAPETAIPVLPQQLPDGYMDALRALFAQGDRAALIGIPLGGMREGYTNSVIGLQGGNATYRYDKHHLVPFDEFIPPLFKWFTEMMNIPLGDFNRGAVRQPSFDWQRAQRLLRRSLRRRPRAAFRRRRHRAHHLRQHQQHRLVRQQRRHRPALADQPHARHRVRAADDPRDEHGLHRHHRPRWACDPRASALDARCAHRHCHGSARSHPLRHVAFVVRACAAVAAGTGRRAAGARPAAASGNP